MAMVWVPSDNGFTNSKGEIGVWVNKPDPPKKPVRNNVSRVPAPTPAPIVPTYNPYAEMLEAQKAQYEEIKRMREEQLAQQRKAADEQYNSRVKNINSGADEILRQAYISKMQNERQLPQSLKGMGISGGMSETTLQNLNANYQNNRQKTEDKRMTSINEAASDRDTLKTRAYDDFLESNISALQAYNDKVNQIKLMKAQEDARNAAMVASSAKRSSRVSRRSSEPTKNNANDTRKTAGYQYAIKLLNSGKSSEDIYSQMKNSGFSDSSIAEYLYLMGIR